MGLIVWWGIATQGFGQPAVYLMTRILQTIILVIVGATQVAGSVGGVRESNILDFHRISPLPPLATTLGFFLGAPIREYILFALTLPLGPLLHDSAGFPEPALFFEEIALLW